MHTHYRPRFDPAENKVERWSVRDAGAGAPANQPSKPNGWGGWSDARDPKLCMSMIAAARPDADDDATAAQFKWLAEISVSDDDDGRRRL
jgi:hypothetical protein